MADGYGLVTGKVTIEAEGVPRDLTAVSFLPFDVPGTDDGNGQPLQSQQVVGVAVSAADGTYTMQLEGFQDEVIVVALDAYGEVFRPSRSYLVGDKIRPTVGNETGYVYRCTVAGTSGITEPTWWENTGGASLGVVGTATFEAIEAWWPVAHAPIMPIWVPDSTLVLDPFFNDVLVLCHADAADQTLVVDPYYDSVRLHLTGEDVVDSGPGSIQNIVLEGGVASTAARNKFGTQSLAFNGSTSLMEVTDGSLPLGTGDFCMEAWIWVTAGGTRRRMFNWSSGMHFSLESDLKPSYLSGGSLYAKSSIAVVAQTWTHVAMTRESGIFRLFVDGVLGVELTRNHPITQSMISVGGLSNNSWDFSGSMEDIRLTVGVARYNIAGFTPPAAALPTYKSTGDVVFTDVVQNGTSFERFSVPVIDTVEAPVFGSGCLKLYDSGLDVVRSLVDGEFNWGVDDYTIEFWFKADDLSFSQTIMGFQFDAVTAGPNLWVDTADGNKLKLMIAGVDRLVSVSGITAGAWYFVAVCRATGTTRLFLDGVQQGSSYGDTASLNFNRFRLGADYLGDNRFRGFLDDIRVTAAARYTAGFALPVQAFPDSRFSDVTQYPEELDPLFPSNAILLPFEGGAISDAVLGHTWETFGSVAVVAAAGALDGEALQLDHDNNSAIRLPNTSWPGLGSDDFTLEVWVHPTDFPTGPSGGARIFQNADGDIYTGLSFGYNPALTLQVYGNVDGTISWPLQQPSCGSISMGGWSHVCLERLGDQWTVYVNGFITKTFTFDGDLWQDPAGWSIIGGQSAGVLRSINGYLDDFRLTVGAVRYGGPFTPPAEPHPVTRFTPGLEATILDEYFQQVVTLYHFDGGVSQPIVNKADTPGEIDLDLFTGPFTTITDLQWGDSSLFFPSGSHAEIRGHASSGSIWTDLGAKDITLEGWFKFNGLAGGIFQQGASGANSSTGPDATQRNGLDVRNEANGRVSVYAGNLNSFGATGYLHLQTDTAVITWNIWHHIAFVIKNQVPYVFIDGVQMSLSLGNGTYTETTFVTQPVWTPAPWCIGAYHKDNGGPMAGSQSQYSLVNNNISFVDDLRITYAARYDNSFTIPAEAWPDFEYDPLENLGGGGGIDPVFDDQYLDQVVFLNNFENIADGVAYNADQMDGGQLLFFDGAVMDDTIKKWTGGSLLIPSGQANPPHAAIPGFPDLTSGENFTLELWWLPQAGLAAAAVLVDGRDTGLNGDHITLGASAAGILSLAVNGSDVITGSTGIFTNTWHHIALARSGGATRLFLNGIQEGSDLADSIAYTTGSGVLYLGASAFASPRTDPALGSFGGYRFTQGVARYTAGFAVPLLPFSLRKYTELTQPWLLDYHWADTDTVLNLNNDLDNVGNGSSTWNGNLTAFVGESVHGSHSLSIGPGAYLNSLDLPDFGTADFCFECWFKVPEFGGESSFLFDNRSPGTPQAEGIVLYIPSLTNVLNFWNDGVNKIVGGTNVRDGQWHHVAIHRDTQSEDYGMLTMTVDGMWEGWLGLGSIPGDTNFINGASGFVIGSGSWAGLGVNCLNGQLDDIRIQVGSNRFDGCFQPPVIEHGAAAIGKRQNTDTRVMNWTDEMLKNPRVYGATEKLDWIVDVAAGSLSRWGWLGGDNNHHSTAHQMVAVPPGTIAVGMSGMGWNSYTAEYDAGTGFVRFFDAAGNWIIKGGRVHGSIVDDISSEWIVCLVPPEATHCEYVVNAHRYTANSGNNYNHGRLYDPGLKFLVLTGDPFVITPLIVENHDFELGNLSGWTTLVGSPAISSDNAQISLGTYGFGGGLNSGSAIYQDVDIPEGSFQLFNATVGVNISYWDTDYAEVWIQPLDAGGGVMASFTEAKIKRCTQQKGMTASFFERLPPGAKKIRFILRVVRGITGTGINAGLDEVYADVIQDPTGILADYLGI